MEESVQSNLRIYSETHMSTENNFFVKNIVLHILEYYRIHKIGIGLWCLSEIRGQTIYRYATPNNAKFMSLPEQRIMKN